MTVSADPLLLRWMAGWTAASFLLLFVPTLWPAFAVGLAALALLVGQDIRRTGSLATVEIDRCLPERATLGQPSEIRLRLVNRAAAAVEAEVLDEVPADLAGAESYFPRVAIAAGATVELRYSVRPTMRGDRPLGRAVALVRSPLGLVRRRVVREHADVLRVYPDTSQLLRREALDPRRVLRLLGAKPRRERGEGMDFESLREYVPGDDPRRIDWPASARRGRPIVRRFQHERNHVVLIAVDTSRLMGARSGERTKLDFAIDAALALSYAALVSGDRVGMITFDREVHGFVAPRAYRRDLGQFIELLRPQQPRLREADYRALARTLGTRQRQRALMVVLTDFVEAHSETLAAPLSVLARRHQTLLVAMRDPLFDEIGSEAGGARSPLEVYRRLVLDDLLREREAALAALRRRGLLTVDLPPAAITSAVLNRYLAIRHGAER